MKEPDRYELQALLGRGGMGQVHRAWDRALDHVVALKTIRPDRADERLVDRFRIEAALAARLAHPHVLPALDTGTLADGRPFLAMPLAEGSLAVVRGWDALRPRLLEVLAALGAIHSRGVLHRDLKPENVLMLGGRAAVADLGLAGWTEELVRGGSDRAGTPRYMPPEQQDGDVRRFGPPLDLFAFGAMVAVLAGDDPVPAGLCALVDACLQPSPGDRPQLAADLARALATLGPADARLPPRMLDGVVGSTLPDPGDDEAPTPFGAAPTRFVAPVPVPPPPEPPPDPVVDLRPSPALFALREGPLVGRDEERRRLWLLARGVAEHQTPAVVVIEGEAGAGKTRLVASVVQALEEGGHARTVRIRHAADGIGRVPGLDELRVRLAEEAVRGFAVLWVDDAQWASPGGALDRVRALAVGDTPVLIVVGVRSEERREIEPILAELRAAGATTIALQRLDREATVQLLSASIALQPEVLGPAADRCEGNPLVARQLVLHWAASGALVDDGGLRYALRIGADLADPVPADLGALLLGRVRAAVGRSRDPGRLADALDRLALAGRELPGPVFAALAAGAQEEVLASGLVRRERDGFRWDQRVLRDAVRAAAVAGPGARAAWRAVADAWRAAPLEAGTEADAVIGLALQGAGSDAEALPHLLRAAAAATHGVAPRALVVLSEAAVAAAAAAGTPGDRARAAHSRAQALQELGRPAEALAVALAALDKAGAAEAPLAAQAALIELVAGRLEPAAALAARALGASHSPSQRSIALRAVGLVARARGDAHGAEVALRQALALARADGRPEEAARVGLTLGELLTATGRLADAEAVGREILAAVAGGPPRLEAHALQHLAVIASRRGDPASAERSIRRAIELVVRAGASGGPQLRATLGEVLAVRGDYAGARLAFEAFLRFAIARGSVAATIAARFNLADLAALERDVAALGVELDALEPLVPAGHWYRVHFTLLQALERTGNGDRDAAAAALAGLPAELRRDPTERPTLERLRAAVAERHWQDVLAAVDRVAAVLVPPA